MYHTFSETEALLLTALSIKGKSIKSIAKAISLKPNTLYKWKCGLISLSANSMDRLFLHLKNNEPDRLSQAEAMLQIPL